MSNRELNKEIIEVVEYEVKKQYNLSNFATTEVSLNRKALKFKFYEPEGTDMAIKVPMDKALDYYYYELLQADKLNANDVTEDDFKRLYEDGVAIEDMAEAVRIDKEITEQ